MTTRDLMIGDFVTWKDCQHDEKPMVIEIVGLGWDGDEDEALVCINGSRGCDIIGIDEEIVGIPLTEEILRNNFPTPKLIVWFPFEYSWHCETRTNTDIMVSGNFRYVHELQRTLRLCKIEKTIEL